MDEKPVTADVVVACLFAGVGAWGAAVKVLPDTHTYASELFGEGHAAISYPKNMTPMVTLTIPQDLPARSASDGVVACEARDHSGSAEVTFTLLAGVFDANVTGLMWKPTPAAGAVPAPAAVATIESGGRKGHNSITISVKEAEKEEAAEADDAVRSSAEATLQSATCAVEGAEVPQTISFALPELTGLDGALNDASKAKGGMRQVSLRAESRIISGAFSDGFLTGGQLNGYTTPVVMSRDAVTLSADGADMRNIVIKGDSAFKAVKEANPTSGYVPLATVTVSTRTEHVVRTASETDAMPMFRLQSSPTDGKLDPTPATDGHIYTPAKSQTKVAHTLLGLDGEEIDAGLRGVLRVNAMGTRDLFNEDDMLFIDYDSDGKMGGGEEISVDPDMTSMAMGSALSIDPDNSESFKGGTGTFGVYYKPGGKGTINHGAMIKLTATVDYSDPSALDEAPKGTSTEFKFEGVASEVMAYAIPFDGNGKGDKANVRVRCEVSAGCRVFLECWDDMGMRSFGEAGTIPGSALATWNAAAIEEVLGIDEAASRHSCRILSAGMVRVQQLTRDGTSGTLVNNTYIGE